MLTLMRFLPALLVAVLLSGCAGFAKQSYTPTPATPIKQVLIAVPAEFPKVTMGIGGSMGLMFGPLGAAAAAYDAGEKSQTLDDMISAQGVGYQQQLIEQIRANFAAVGILTETVAVKREGRDVLVEDYASLLGQKKADAILDLFVWEASYGGTHPLLDPLPRPILRVRAQMVSGTSFEKLYADEISFGYSNPFMDAKELKAPKKYYFTNWEEIGGDRERAAEGMRVAATEVARFLTGQFTAEQNVAASK